MPIVYRDAGIAALYVEGEDSPLRHVQAASALAEAARAILAEQLQVRALTLEVDGQGQRCTVGIFYEAPPRPDDATQDA